MSVFYHFSIIIEGNRNNKKLFLFILYKDDYQSKKEIISLACIDYNRWLSNQYARVVFLFFYLKNDDWPFNCVYTLRSRPCLMHKFSSVRTSSKSNHFVAFFWQSAEAHLVSIFLLFFFYVQSGMHWSSSSLSTRGWCFNLNKL